MSISVLKVNDLRKSFADIVALDGISFDLGKGEILGIFGPNGAGKSTLISIVAGLIKPGSGSVLIEGKDIFDYENIALRRKIGLISHQRILYQELTCYENLYFFARLYFVDKPDERVRYLLDKVKLYERKDEPVYRFSSGMKQRVAIARALIADPEIIIMDEPFTGLDRSLSNVLVDIMQALKSEDRSIIMVTHDLDLGFKITDHLILQNKGKISFEADTKDLMKDQFVKLYLDLVKN